MTSSEHITQRVILGERSQKFSAVCGFSHHLISTLLSISFLFCVSIVFNSVSSSSVWAQKKESMKKRLEKEKTVRRQHLMRDGRIELSASIGASLGDPYMRNYPIGVSATYFLNDRWGIRGGGFFSLSSETFLAEQIRALRPKRVNADGFSSVGLGFGGDLLYTMIHGKFSPLGIGAVRYDLALTGGVGLLQVNGYESKFAVAPNLGINSHFFLSDHLALSVFYKLYVYPHTDHQILVNNQPTIEEDWSGHSFGGLSFSFFTGKVKVSAE